MILSRNSIRPTSAAALRLRGDIRADRKPAAARYFKRLSAKRERAAAREEIAQELDAPNLPLVSLSAALAPVVPTYPAYRYGAVYVRLTGNNLASMDPIEVWNAGGYVDLPASQLLPSDLVDSYYLKQLEREEAWGEIDRLWADADDEIARLREIEETALGRNLAPYLAA